MLNVLKSLKIKKVNSEKSEQLQVFNLDLG